MNFNTEKWLTEVVSVINGDSQTHIAPFRNAIASESRKSRSKFEVDKGGARLPLVDAPFAFVPVVKFVKLVNLH